MLRGTPFRHYNLGLPDGKVVSREQWGAQLYSSSRVDLILG